MKKYGRTARKSSKAKRTRRHRQRGGGMFDWIFGSKPATETTSPVAPTGEQKVVELTTLPGISTPTPPSNNKRNNNVTPNNNPVSFTTTPPANATRPAPSAPSATTGGSRKGRKGKKAKKSKKSRKAPRKSC